MTPCYGDLGEDTDTPVKMSKPDIWDLPLIVAMEEATPVRQKGHTCRKTEEVFKVHVCVCVCVCVCERERERERERDRETERTLISMMS